MANLIELDDVQVFQPDADETKTNLLIAGYSKRIQDKVGFDLEFRETTEKVWSKGGKYLPLSRYPIYAVSSVQYEGQDLSDWERYEEGNRWGRLFRCLEWPVGYSPIGLTRCSTRSPVAIEVTYQAGYVLPGTDTPPGDAPALPDDVKILMIELIRNALIGKESEIASGGKFVAKKSVGNMSIQYSQTSTSSSEGKSAASAQEANIIAEIVDSLKRKNC